jgi:hypothetical protein
LLFERQTCRVSGCYGRVTLEEECLDLPKATVSDGEIYYEDVGKGDPLIFVAV